jgi:hypothetical protein
MDPEDVLVVLEHELSYVGGQRSAAPANQTKDTTIEGGDEACPSGNIEGDALGIADKLTNDCAVAARSAVAC